MTHAEKPAPSQSFSGAWALWGIFAAITLWHLLLSLQIALGSAGTAGGGGGGGMNDLAVGLGALVHWRRVDGLLGWIALTLLILTRPTSGRLGDRRFSLLLLAATGLGFLLASLAIAWEQFSLPGGTVPGALADLWLALTGIVAAIAMLLAVSREMNARGGAGVIDLWRMAAANWSLAWIGSVLYLRFVMKQEDVLGMEGARQLLFGMPAWGILPNLLMAAAATGEPPLTRGPWKVRLRAWLLAVGAANIGGVLLVLRPGSATAIGSLLGVSGAAFLAFGLLLFLVGFPRRTAADTAGLAGTGPGRYLLAAAAALLLALATAALERLLIASSTLMGTAFVGAIWRTLLYTALFFWLASLGLAWQDVLLPPNRQTRAKRIALLAAVAYLLGTLLLSALLLNAALIHGDSQTSFLRALLLGILLQTFALILLAPLLLRLSRQLPPSVP